MKSRSHQMNPGDDGKTEEEKCLKIKASKTGKFKDMKELFVLFLFWVFLLGISDTAEASDPDGDV